MPLTTVTPARRSASLDGLRAVAALSVLATHVAGVTGFARTESWLSPLANRLNVGVAIFFVLSGYLLSRPWLRRLDRGAGRPSVRGYAIRRAARILPAYWAALLATSLLFPAMVIGPLGNEWWAYWGLLQAYDPQWTFSGLTVAWSLSTEVAFYVALPAVAVGLLAVARTAPDRAAGTRRLLLALVVTALVAQALRLVNIHVTLLSTFDNTLIGKWPWFAIGTAVAAIEVGRPRGEPVARRRRRAPALGSPWWLVLAAGLLAFSAWGPLLPNNPFTYTPTQNEIDLWLFGAIAAASLLGALPSSRPGSRPMPSVLGIAPLVWLGQISYGIFLWHLPLLEWLYGRVDGLDTVGLGVLGLLASVLFGAASWYLVERPTLHLVRRGSSRSRPDERPSDPRTPILEPAP